MKPLDDEKKEKIFDDIVKSISYIYQPAPGEFTVQMIMEALSEHDISRDKICYRLRKLMDAEVIGKREIMKGGTKGVIYFLLRDVSYEEILEILLE